ncbi:MAG: hypothetical protein BJ554DRAFT_2408, partial [Olpidium bornovanus]
FAARAQPAVLPHLPPGNSCAGDDRGEFQTGATEQSLGPGPAHRRSDVVGCPLAEACGVPRPQRVDTALPPPLDLFLSSRFHLAHSAHAFSFASLQVHVHRWGAPADLRDDGPDSEPGAERAQICVLGHVSVVLRESVSSLHESRCGPRLRRPSALLFLRDPRHRGSRSAVAVPRSWWPALIRQYFQDQETLTSGKRPPSSPSPPSQRRGLPWFHCPSGICSPRPNPGRR